MKRVYSPLQMGTFIVSSESAILAGSMTEMKIASNSVVIEEMTEDPDADFLDLTFKAN